MFGICQALENLIGYDEWSSHQISENKSNIQHVKQEHNILNQEHYKEFRELTSNLN